MKCAYSHERLAAYIEGDAPRSWADNVRSHLLECTECQDVYLKLQQSQMALKSLRNETATASHLDAVRRGVMSSIDMGLAKPGWSLRLERFIFSGLKRPRLAMAGLTVIAVLSASLLGQIPVTTQTAQEVSVAVFEGKNTLLRPEGYREWVFVGSSLGLNYAPEPPPVASGNQLFHNVYIDPVAFKSYSGTGEFPEGTVLILELANSAVKQEPGLQGSYQKDFVALEASVKDSSRFDGGWAYFGFTDGPAI